MTVTSRWPNNDLQSRRPTDRPSSESSANRKLGKATEFFIFCFIFSDDPFYFTSSSYELLLVKEPRSELKTQQVVVSMTVCAVSSPSDSAGERDTLEPSSKMHNTNNNITSQLNHGAIETQAFGV